MPQVARPVEVELGPVTAGSGVDPKKQSQQEASLLPGEPRSLAPRVPPPQAEVVAAALQLRDM